MAVVVYVPSRLGEGFFTDLPAPTAGDDVKAITYDHGTGAFVYMPFETAGAVATHVGLADPHTQYALEASLGTAALLNVGTGANNIVQLNGSSQLPAVSGALLTNLPGGTPPGSDTQVLFNDAGAFGADAGLTYAKATDRLTVAGGLVAPSMRPASDSTTALQWQNAAGTAFIYGDSTNSILSFPVSTGTNRGVGFKASSPYDNIAMLTVYPISGTNVGALIQVSPKGTGYSSTSKAQIVVFNTDQVSDANNNEFLTLRARGADYRIFCDYAGTGSKRPIIIGADNREDTVQIYLATTGNVGVQNNAPTALLDLAASTTTRASLRIRSGVAPTSPNVGDMYQDGTHAYMYLAGAWRQLDN